MSIAGERIEKLYEKAEQRCRDGDEELCRRYVQLARKIGERTQTTVPKKYRARTCQNCLLYLIPGKNCTVRTGNGKTKYTCKCGEKNTVVTESL